MKNRYAAVPAFITKDGSEIRELMQPSTHGNHAQSLAEAIVAPGATTLLHRHRLSEELYHITAGHGRMTLGEECFDVGSGDTICITPGTPHCIVNIGTEPLRILCCCAPPYSHGDTELLELPSGDEA